MNLIWILTCQEIHDIWRLVRFCEGHSNKLSHQKMKVIMSRKKKKKKEKIGYTCFIYIYIYIYIYNHSIFYIFIKNITSWLKSTLHDIP
jgi:hypothetical protein